MRLFSQYRLFLLAALGVVYYFSTSQSILGQRDALLFEIAHLGYLVASLGIIYLQMIDRPSPTTRLYLQHYLDISFICLMLYASGGVQSGFGILLIITIALLSQLNTVRNAFYFASLACVLLLIEELVANMLIGPEAADFQRTAFLGSMLLLVAWLLTVPLRKLSARQIPEHTHSRAALDVHEIAHLNEEIIRELDSGVVVLDAYYQVQLINDTAREMLACEFSPLPIHIARLCNNLFEHLNSNKQGQIQSQTLMIEPTGLTILPRYINLSSGGMLIKLDDHALVRKQFQQLKMASLGRLSASIAHEIRNPLGAIAHSVQLLQESEQLDDVDAELLSIAHKNTARIDRIVEDVLQLSSQKPLSNDALDLSTLVSDFCSRYTAENKLNESHISAQIEPNIIAVFDPDHLDQVLWNLCTNARLHNNNQPIHITINCWQSKHGFAVLDVMDNGVGIHDLERDQLFEPFYSTHHNGSGLGLYIIREICELNKAHIECIESNAGAHFRITLGTQSQMAA